MAIITANHKGINAIPHDTLIKPNALSSMQINKIVPVVVSIFRILIHILF